MSEIPSTGEQDQSQHYGPQGPNLHHVGEQPFSFKNLEGDSCRGGACQCNFPALMMD